MSGAGMGIRPFRVWPRKAALRTVEKQVEPIKKWHIVRGDLVEILSGRDAGKTGKVKQVIRSENRVVVEGLNLVKRHVKVADGSAGGVVAVESPVHYSNINLVDPATGYVLFFGTYLSLHVRLLYLSLHGCNIPPLFFPSLALFLLYPPLFAYYLPSYRFHVQKAYSCCNQMD